MDTNTLTEIAKWLKTTDLAEASYKKDGKGFELRTEEAEVKSNVPSCSLTVVAAPAVGIYHSAAKGKAPSFKEGKAVAADQPMGYVDMAGEKRPVTASAAGTLKIILAEEGRPVEYGQPLFFIEPN